MLAAAAAICMAALPGTAQDAPQGQDGPTTPHFRTLPQPSLNFYGVPGVIDMPSGEMLPDGQFTTTVSYFGGQGRYTLTFQPTPWMSASFRYNSISNWNLNGFPTYYDRGFDVRFRLAQEGRYRPQITLGLQDFAGTGIYAAEYLVATKTFQTPPMGASRLPGRLKLSAGLGWGRLGSFGSFGGFGNRPPYDPANTGGQLSYDQWFRGPMALFGGLEWQVDEKWALKLEYSSDDYVTETRTTSVFRKKSPVNFGVEWQASPRTRLGAYYLYGSEFGLSAQIQLNPKQPPMPMTVPAPQPVAVRPDRATNPEAWNTSWAEAKPAPLLRSLLGPILKDDGLVLESLDVSAARAELRFRNTRYMSNAIAIGRAARALARVMPPSVETFDLVLVSRGLSLSRVTLRRSDLEALEFDPEAPEAILAVAGIGAAGPPAETAVFGRELYPDFSWSVAPYFAPAYFDPQQPVRIDVGLDFGATYQPAPGWVISGRVFQRLAGNLKDGRVSTSALPPVRTDQALYAQYGTTLNNLYVARYWQPGEDLYARVTAGYFEYGYGGLSTELLWKPVNSLLGLGVELNYALKRDYNQRLGFRDYRVFTGHASAYMDFGNGLHGQVDVGRYLAGDVGATFAMDRIFANGWSVGAFFTLTNVSAAEFGEGSFDKGIRFSMPLGWFLGKPSRKSMGTVIRPIQRDGGARLTVPGRLYGEVRKAHQKALTDQWAGFWE
ncbi:Exopolysaccharide biosynthesis protein YbjH [Ruegeria marina]|uniref:Exopolysaccharide biosynthesis protein YbjH n=2 Tax=Ruegeria marina TaxID=639004 RepID=A0A1G7E8J2_9RHOB|nr:Exopolysaccharide biosynthesis protein YbjH [Ruegeria marina]